MNNIVTKILLIAMNLVQQIVSLPFQMLYILWCGLWEWCGDLVACFDLSNYDEDGDEPAVEKPTVEKHIGFHK